MMEMQRDKAVVVLHPLVHFAAPFAQRVGLHGRHGGRVIPSKKCKVQT